PRDADLEGAWWSWFFRAGAVADPRQDRFALARYRDYRDGSEFARPRRAYRKVRHRGTEAVLPAAPCTGGRSAMLLPHRADLRFRCRYHARHRLRGSRDFSRQGD